MKKILYILVLLPIALIGQTTTENYVKTTTYRGPGATLPVSQVTYFDGLGRPIQQIANAQSNSGKDIVTHIEYDAFGRQTKEYLPYPSSQNTMSFINAATAQQNTISYYQGLYGDGNPFSEKLLETSPVLNRVLSQAAPGNAWALGSGHEIKTEYQTNAAAEVKYFKATATWNAGSGLYDISISNPNNYVANQLYKTVTKDENWTSGDNKTTQEFKNQEGKVVLKRTFNNGAHDTYYVYDQYGNLTYVLPPLAEGGFTTTILDGLCYQYKYDHRNRLAAKKLPGKENWEYIVYDKQDRPVATGPVNSPWGNGTSGILITKYDDFGRIWQTGWKMLAMTETSRNGWQGNITGGSNPFVLAELDLLTQNYYDNYNVYPNTAPTIIEGQTVATNVKGMPTGSWTRMLTTPSGTESERDFTFYDTQYRPVFTFHLNHLGGHTIVTHKLDFMGKTLQTATGHQGFPNNSVIYAVDYFSYSAQDRLTLQRKQVNSLPVQLIANNAYDELGQLISKKVGGEDATGAVGLQKVDYSYNIRGWLKGINNTAALTQGTDPQDLFSFKINYNNLDTDPDTYSVPALYNGNISETFWKTSTDNVLRKYGYNYDNLNRLKEAVYQKPGLSSPVRHSYNEFLDYDKNGNITHLARTGEYDDEIYELTIDDLTYSYNPAKPNQLAKVFDSTNNAKGFADDSNGVTDDTDDYTYDGYGNMLSDTNKGIEEIKYNHLNLPTAISINNETITYIYNALGRKVQKKAPESVGGDGGMTTKVTDYFADGFQYKGGMLLFFPHAEGYVNVLGSEGNTNNDYNYVFNYTDHLGNVRLSYGVDPQTQVLTALQENHYYPYGMKHVNYNTSQKTYIRGGVGVGIGDTAPEWDYKFNGKELQEELGLNWYDYQARNYDPAIGRWMNIDPLAELSRRWSPYNYTYNNPVRYIDPDGMLSQDTVNDMMKKSNEDGETKWAFNDNGTASGSNGESVDVENSGSTGDPGDPPSAISKFFSKIGSKLDKKRHEAANKLADKYEANDKKIMAYSFVVEALVEVTAAGELLTFIRESMADTYGTQDTKDANEVYSNVISIVKQIKDEVGGGKLTDSYVYQAAAAFGVKAIGLQIDNSVIALTIQGLDKNVYYNRKIDPTQEHQGGSFSGGGSTGKH